ncbi:FAR-17a/AIG1-like protein [Glaciihabitans tibetensis]|uniref:FAR-17a/AIG1-like protein n=2 Tax=Glaciihabitans tibetensis TaxID=1266600 RepID=A0A2T0V2G8_9MICO|nr:FAR-17a/AIG1-like protein [Glaciihabitans tibetensis]
MRFVRWLRLIVAASIAAAVVATLAETASRTTINPFNFFGYFTIQSNLIGCVVLVVASVSRPDSPRRDEAILLLRGAATTYLVVVGLVYAVLLAPLGAAGGVPLPWANVVMHVIVPVYFVVDWLLAPDRHPLPWRKFWIVLVYPLAWCAVVLVRGATDGWVPYPFLDPSSGYGSVAFFVALITLVVTAAGAAVWGLSRVPAPGTPASPRA